MDCDTILRRRYLTGPELADLLRISPRTVEAWRLRGQGPPFIRLGARVVYDFQEVEAFLDASRVVPTTPSSQED